MEQDFPREGNNNSFHYARRQYNLADDPLLRYKFLNSWDKAMHHLESRFNFLQSGQYISLKHESDKVIVFERGNLLWVFNLHPSNSYPDYRVGTHWAGKYKIELDSDSVQFGGHGRVDEKSVYFSTPEGWNGRDNYVQVYIPSRSCLILSCDASGYGVQRKE